MKFQWTARLYSFGKWFFWIRNIVFFLSHFTWTENAVKMKFHLVQNERICRTNAADTQSRTDRVESDCATLNAFPETVVSHIWQWIVVGGALQVKAFARSSYSPNMVDDRGRQPVIFVERLLRCMHKMHQPSKETHVHHTYQYTEKMKMKNYYCTVEKMNSVCCVCALAWIEISSGCAIVCDGIFINEPTIIIMIGLQASCGKEMRPFVTYEYMRVNGTHFAEGRQISKLKRSIQCKRETISLQSHFIFVVFIKSCIIEKPIWAVQRVCAHNGLYFLFSPFDQKL